MEAPKSETLEFERWKQKFKEKKRSTNKKERKQTSHRKNRDGD